MYLSIYVYSIYIYIFVCVCISIYSIYIYSIYIYMYAYTHTHTHRRYGKWFYVQFEDVNGWVTHLRRCSAGGQDNQPTRKWGPNLDG